MNRFDIKLFKYPLVGNKVSPIYFEIIEQHHFTEIPTDMVVEMMNLILGTDTLFL